MALAIDWKIRNSRNPNLQKHDNGWMAVRLKFSAKSQKRGEAEYEDIHRFVPPERVVYGANVLRALSDPTRVRVMRRVANSTNEWLINLSKVAMTGEGRSQDNPGVPPMHDLWMRDGDVVQIPERQ